MADDENQKINTRRITDQSALMQNIDTLKNANFVNINNGPFVNGVSLEEEGSLENSGIIINKLYNFKDFIASYNKLTPASLSTLIPYIQIFKIYEDNAEFLIPFNNFYPKSAIDAITSAGSDRGHQANLVNLELVSQGKDTATTFIYQVKLNIIFDSVQTLFNEKSRYIELFNPPKKYSHKRMERDPKYYQIKLKFGWNFNKEIPADLNPKELQTFADFSGSELFLNYVIHKLTINEDGSVALQVEYIGSLEAVGRDSTKLNVLSSRTIDELDNISQKISDIDERLQGRNLKYEKNEDKDGKITIKIVKIDQPQTEQQAAEKNDLERLYNEISSKESNNKKEFMNGILKNIQQQYSGSFPQLKIRSDIYTKRQQLVESFSSLSEQQKIDDTEEAKSIISTDKNPDNVKFEWNVLKPEEVATFNIENYLKNLDTPSAAAASKENPSEFYSIPFFTFGRLLKAIDTLGGKDGKESDFLILCSDCNIAYFGNGNFVDARDLAKNPNYKILINNGLVIGDNLAVLRNDISLVNITQIPIALSTFKYWINKNITSQNLTRMNLINFLNLAIIDLLNLAVKSTNEDYLPTQNIQFKFFLDKVEFNNDNNFLKLIRSNQGTSEILGKSNFNKENIKELILNNQITSSNSIKKNIIIFYCTPTHNVRKSNFKKDLEDGIPHFFYGQNKGIINKISFREENMPFVREANIQTQVDRKPWKAGVFLRGKYNVTIEMLGTVNFRIGSMIYISPSFPGVINYDDPVLYGIGGYFVIISIKTSIESGKYITILEANWVATGTGEFTDLSHLPFKVVKLSKPLIDLEKESAEAKYKSEEKAETKIRKADSMTRASK
jgi:hypothetical protein